MTVQPRWSRHPQRVWVSTAIATWLIACAPRHPIENPSPFDEDDPTAAPARPQPIDPEPAEITEALDLTPRSGEIDQAELNTVLANGPGIYVGGVDVEAILVSDQKLRGWKIIRWDYPSLGLLPGDIVLDVNGIQITSPSDFNTLWASLAHMHRLAIHIERSGIEITLGFEVVASKPDKPDLH